MEKQEGGKEDEVSFGFGFRRDWDESLMETDLLESSLTALEILDSLVEVSVELREDEAGSKSKGKLLKRRKEGRTKVDSNSPG